MEILVAILIIAVLGAIAVVLVQRRRGGAAVGRPHGSPLGRRHGVARSDHPLAAEVEAHAQATDPRDVVAAEQRLQARAAQVAADLSVTAHRSAAAEHERAADQYGEPGHREPARLEREPDYYSGPHRNPAYGDGATGVAYDPASSANHPDPHRDGELDPVTGERVDGYGDPASDPRYDDPRDDGRLAADYDPRPDDRVR